MYTHVFISCWMDAGSRTVRGMHRARGIDWPARDSWPLVTIDDSTLVVAESGGNGVRGYIEDYKIKS